MNTKITTIAIYLWLGNEVDIHRGRVSRRYSNVTHASFERLSDLTYKYHLVNTGVIFHSGNLAPSIYLNVIPS